MSILSRYSKAIAALLTAVAGWWGLVIGGPAHISAGEWRQGFIALSGVILVYVLRNDPPATSKTIGAALDDALEVFKTPRSVRPVTIAQGGPVPSATTTASSAEGDA